MTHLKTGRSSWTRLAALWTNHILVETIVPPMSVQCLISRPMRAQGWISRPMGAEYCRSRSRSNHTSCLMYKHLNYNTSREMVLLKRETICFNANLSYFMTRIQNMIFGNWIFIKDYNVQCVGNVCLLFCRPEVRNRDRVIPQK